MEIEQPTSPDIEAFRAMELLKAGDKIRAINLCHKALDDFGPNGNLFLVKARAHLELGDAGFAEDALLKLLNEEPEHPAGWAMLGEVYFRQGRTVKVEYCRRRLAQIFPAFADCLRPADDIAGAEDKGSAKDDAERTHVPIEELYSSGIVPLDDLSGDGRKTDAKEDNSAGDIFETSTFAEICLAQGKFEKALEIYRRLLKQDPGNETYINKVNMLQSRSEIR